MTLSRLLVDELPTVLIDTTSATVGSKPLARRYGPVNLFWSTRYDKAMVLFLACLKEFADFANARDRSLDVPADKAFTLPYK